MVKTSVPSKKRTAYTTTVFMKRLMAWSGLFFLVFVLFHAYGNTHYFEGEIAYDHYAYFLRQLLVPILPPSGVLWLLRAALMACLLAHAGSAFHLWARNKKARGTDKYAVKKPGADYFASRYAMRTMRWGGVILLLFIIWHILQFTTLTITPGGHYEHGRAYMNMWYGFQLWWVYLIYLVALAALCLHLWHGRVVRSADLGRHSRQHRSLRPAHRIRGRLRGVRRLHVRAHGDPLRLGAGAHGRRRLCDQGRRGRHRPFPLRVNDHD